MYAIRSYYVDVTFVVDEGPRVYIDRINIVGNTQTLDRVIRRELRISEGDAFNRILLDRSKNRVRALGYFKEVDIEEVPTVITSYSIHYTKLYEAMEKDGEISEDRHRALSEEVQKLTDAYVANRITSYNVCYTKLLRQAGPNPYRQCYRPARSAT